MNTNISSIQTIIEALKQQDYITGLIQWKKNTVVIGHKQRLPRINQLQYTMEKTGVFLVQEKIPMACTIGY